VARVCEVVPDVRPEHVSSLLKCSEASFPGSPVEAVVQMLLESPYPKIDKGKGRAKVEDHLTATGGAPELFIDYTRVDRIVSNPTRYRSLALAQLKDDFPDITDNFIGDSFGAHNMLYVPTFLYLEQQKASGSAPVRTGTHQASGRKKKGKASSNHVEFMLEHAWMLEKRKFEAEAQDAELAQELEDEDSGIECGCCFTTYPFSKMIQCPEAHLFCSDCVTSYASTRLGEQNHQITCMDQGGCTAPFTDGELRRVLPSKLLQLYERVRQHRDVEAAELEGLEECPFCDFKAVFDQDPDTDKLFRCQNEECSRVTCRKCKKEDHLPKTCEEADEDKKLEGKHAVEEAMTKALTRNCPKCQKGIHFVPQCNKMTCPSCKTLSCYVCRQVVTGYEHFNVPPHAPGPSKGRKCPLWDHVETRHADEVAQAAKRAKEEYQAKNPEANDADLHVDLPITPNLRPRP
ncbi:hypothetical protein K488DRAFT_33878, partial [Vararia minispora EC-137]